MFIPIIIASIIISIIFSILGCLCIWKKYIYFTDGFAHASIMAAILSILLNIPLSYSLLGFAFIFSIIVFKYRNIADNNIIISLISNFMLSLSIIIVGLSNESININGLLFGDIITVTIEDIYILLFILLIIIIFILLYYDKLIITLISKEIALSRRININQIELIFLMILSFTICITMKIVGALMIIGMLIIPAITSRLFAKTPIMMITLAIIFSLTVTILGLLISIYFDIALAPLIICISSFGYFICTLIKN